MTAKNFRKYCALFAICVMCTALPAVAAESVKKQSTISADDIQYNVNTGEAHAVGNVILTYGAAVLKGDEAEGNTSDQTITIRGNVDGNFPEERITLKSEIVTWTGNKTGKTEGIVEASGNVVLTRGESDRLSADWVQWEPGTDNYSARGNVDSIFEKKILKANLATRKGDKFWARSVRRYEDIVQKFALSAKSVEGRFVTDKKSGQDVLHELTADGNVVMDYKDNEGLTTRVSGDKAVYSRARGTIVVSGNTKATRSDGKTVTADTMVVHDDTRVIEAIGNSRIVFTIEEKKAVKRREEKPKKKRNRKNLSAAPEESNYEMDVSYRENKEKKESDISDRDKSWVEE